IELSPNPVLKRVPGDIHRPSPPTGMQQVRAEIKAPSVDPFEYLFEREGIAWDPMFASDGELPVGPSREPSLTIAPRHLEARLSDLVVGDKEEAMFFAETRGNN